MMIFKLLGVFINRIFKGLRKLISYFLIVICRFFIQIDIVSEGNFINLMLFEIRTCTKNAIFNINNSHNSIAVNENKNSIFNIYKKYGIYIIKTYRNNICVNNAYFHDVFWPIILSLITGFIGFSINTNNGIISYICYSAWFILIFMVCISINAARNSTKVESDFLTNNELIDYFLEKHKDEQFDIDCFSVEELKFFKKNVFSYFKIINKIEKTQIDMSHVKNFKVIDIFNLENNELIKTYGLTEKEIIIYGGFKELREKFFLYNEIK